LPGFDVAGLDFAPKKQYEGSFTFSSHHQQKEVNMKKLSLVLVVCLILVFAFTAQAQFKMAVGGGMGLNLNLYSGSDVNGGSGLGFAVAGQADMSFSKTIGILTSIYFYDNRSGSYTQTGNYQGTNYSMDISASVAYFEIEPLFKLKLEEAPVYFVLGPSLGFNVENSVDVKTTANNQSSTQKSTIQNMNTRFEIKAGGGYTFPLSKTMRINSQLTFGYGLANVVKDVNWKILSFGLLASFEIDVVK